MHHEVGMATADSEEGALKDAQKAAAVKVMNYWFKQTVSEQYSRIREDAQRHVLDAISTKGQGQVAGGKQVKSVVARLRIHQADGSVRYRYKAYVWVRYTMRLLEAAIADFKAQKEAKTFLAIECRSQPPGACGFFVEAAAKKAATDAGFQVVGTTTKTTLPAEATLCAKARAKNAIYLMRLQVHGSLLSSVPTDSVHWAKTDAQASLIQAHRCAVIRQWSPKSTTRPFKVGAPKAYSSPTDTVQASIRRALQGDAQDPGFRTSVANWQQVP